jgi:AcrR family transcriptional regulator
VTRARAATRARLSSDDWAHAALAAIGEGGLAAVAIEPLAARLGATKGSFYWHFANREALVAAALAVWERERTELVIAHVERVADPVARLRRLLIWAVDPGIQGRVETALLATADHPMVAPVLQRVTERRVGYLTDLFAEIGREPDDARAHALLIYSVFLGHIQLTHATPGLLPTDAEARRRYLDRVLRVVQSTR